MTTTIGNKQSQDFFGVNLTKETAMHALTRDAEGLLTYTRVNINSAVPLNMTNGEGLAYENVEEFVKGVTASGVVHNTVPKGDSEVSRKNFLGETFQVKILNPQSGTPSFEINNRVITQLDLVKGATYKFTVTDPSTDGYPLFISAVPTGGNYTNEYLTNVTNSRASYGGHSSDPMSYSEVFVASPPLTITIPADAPDVLYLLSGNHADFKLTLYTTRQTQHADLKNRYYDQVKFDDKKVTYFINEDGYLVARYNEDYNYS